MSFGEKLREARELRGYTQQQIADRMGIDKSTYCGYETGKRQPDVQKIKIISKILGVSGDALLETDFVQVNIPIAPNISAVPGLKEWNVLGGTACGDPLYMELDGETILAPDNIDADFVFRCIGDSMIGARILDGDIVFVKAGNVEDGQIAVVRIGEEYTLKRIYRGENYLELRAENPAYPPKIIRGDQENAEIVGRAVHFLSRVI